jgi:acyl carrier protein
MKTPAEIESAVVSAIKKVAPEADPTRVPRDADIRDELDIDSMDFLSYVTAIHRELGVDIPERDYPKLTSIEGAVRHLTTLVGP